MYLKSVEMILIITLLLLAVANDLHCYKIRNGLTVTFIIIGLSLQIMLGNHNSLQLSILGIAAPLIMLFPLYALKMLGAGDIKLFCAIGALAGMNNVLLSMAYSFIFGFFIAIIIFLIRRNFLARIHHLYSYLKYCVMTMSIGPYNETMSKNDGLIHFSIPIALGTVAVSIWRFI